MSDSLAPTNLATRVVVETFRQPLINDRVVGIREPETSQASCGSVEVYPVLGAGEQATSRTNIWDWSRRCRAGHDLNVSFRSYDSDSETAPCNYVARARYSLIMALCQTR
jgi:hypothetical protein